MGVATVEELIYPIVRTGMRIVNAGQRVGVASSASSPEKASTRAKVIDAQIL